MISNLNCIRRHITWSLWLQLPSIYITVGMSTMASKKSARIPREHECICVQLVLCCVCVFVWHVCEWAKRGHMGMDVDMDMDMVVWVFTKCSKDIHHEKWIMSLVNVAISETNIRIHTFIHTMYIQICTCMYVLRHA